MTSCGGPSPGIGGVCSSGPGGPSRPSVEGGREDSSRIRVFLAIAERASWSLGSGLVLSSVLASAMGPGLVLPVFGLCPPLALMVAGLALIAVAVCALVYAELVVPGRGVSKAPEGASHLSGRHCDDAHRDVAVLREDVSASSKFHFSLMRSMVEAMSSLLDAVVLVARCDIRTSASHIKLEERVCSLEDSGALLARAVEEVTELKKHGARELSTLKGRILLLERRSARLFPISAGPSKAVKSRVSSALLPKPKRSYTSMCHGRPKLSVRTPLGQADSELRARRFQAAGERGIAHRLTRVLR